MKAWGRAVDLEEKIAAQGDVMVSQKGEIAGLKEENKKQKQEIAKLQQKVGEQNRAILGFQKSAEALTHVFTFSTRAQSETFTFTDGVTGYCSASEFSSKDENDNTHWMGFTLLKGPAGVSFHYKCSVLRADDGVYWDPTDGSACDFLKPPMNILPAEQGNGMRAHNTGRGKRFELDEEDKAHVVRTNGRVNFRMVVHLYL